MGLQTESINIGADVRNAPRDELIICWRRAYGRPPPTGISRQLLELAAAWTLQAKNRGGLSAKTKRRLKRIVAAGEPQAPAKLSHRLEPGTRLAREWNGKTHVVDMTAEGALYEGKTYRSLSAAARAITGARWSGPRFFGLDRKTRG